MPPETSSIEAAAEPDARSPRPDLDLSVVLTLVDHRGPLGECVASWTREQTLGRNRYEVVVVGTEREAAVEEQVKPRLTPGDRLLRFEARQELALHDHGARQAQGRWLLFTEAHCLAAPTCLERLLEYLQAHAREYVGACLRSQSAESEDPVSGMEDRLYREGAAVWTREGDWRKVTIRGFAIRRDVYLKVGGFEHEFGYFGESALAATLDHRNYRLGYAADAGVTHFNSTELDDLLSYVAEYREREEAYRAQCDVSYFARYFGDGSDSLELAASRGSAIVCGARTLAWALGRLDQPGRRNLARAMVRELVGCGWKLVSGPHVSGRLACGWARCRLRLSRDANARFRWFKRLWDATGGLARRRALARRPRSASAPTPGETRLAYAPAEMSVRALAGFHARESWDGRSFRWSAPLAWLRVDVPPGEYEVVIDTGGLRRFTEGTPLLLYLNGHRATTPPGPHPSGSTRFTVRREMFREPSSQEIILACSRLSTEGPERRRLGVPIFGLGFQAAPPADTAAATF
jgi:hypothetical protein